MIDVMFPQPLLMLALRDFKRQFPATPLRLYIEALGAVSQRVLDGECSLGVTGTLPFPPPTLTAEPLLSEQLVTVVAPDSPLAAAGTPVPLHRLIGEMQLVLTDRSRLTDGTDYGVQGRTSGSWRTYPPSTRSCTRGSAGGICHAGWWLTILSARRPRRVAWCRSCWRGGGRGGAGLRVGRPGDRTAE